MVQHHPHWYLHPRSVWLCHHQWSQVPRPHLTLRLAGTPPALGYVSKPNSEPQRTYVLYPCRSRCSHPNSRQTSLPITYLRSFTCFRLYWLITDLRGRLSRSWHRPQELELHTLFYIYTIFFYQSRVIESEINLSLIIGYFFFFQSAINLGSSNPISASLAIFLFWSNITSAGYCLILSWCVSHQCLIDNPFWVA